jgi:hypothetical protein
MQNWRAAFTSANKLGILAVEIKRRYQTPVVRPQKAGYRSVFVLWSSVPAARAAHGSVDLATSATRDHAPSGISRDSPSNR